MTAKQGMQLWFGTMALMMVAAFGGALLGNAQPETVRERRAAARAEKAEKAAKPQEAEKGAPTLLEPVPDPISVKGGERPFEAGECAWTYVWGDNSEKEAPDREYRECIVIAGPYQGSVLGDREEYLVRLFGPGGSPSQHCVMRKKTELLFRHARDSNPNQKTDWQ